MVQLPEKLKRDAIIEALVELRFETEEAPEIVVGRLTDNPKWATFKRTRTAIAELPSMIRLSDPNLRFQPHFDLREGHRNIKIGTNVISLHILEEYCGWPRFRDEIGKMVFFLFERISRVSVRRIGLRYINHLNVADHLIKGVEDLNLQIQIGGALLKEYMNLNYQRATDHSRAMIRVASPDMVDGAKRPDMTAYIDVDVFTPNIFALSDPQAVMKWVEDAHVMEKTEFFRLLPDKIVEAIKEA